MSDYEDFMVSDDEEIVKRIQRRDYIIRNRSDPLNIWHRLLYTISIGQSLYPRIIRIDTASANFLTERPVT